MTEYIYIPDDDSEYGPVWWVREALEQFSGEELHDATEAELVLSLDGARGHYLAAGYLEHSADILEEATLGVGTTVDLSNPENFGLRDRVSDLMWEAREVAETYERHNALGTDITCATDGSVCKCDYVHEVADDMESVLSELGYVTAWNDGVTVYRVSDTPAFPNDPATED